MVKQYLICVLICYLIGSINPAYIIARLKDFDIREAGSKNAGATNALISMGNTIGVLCMIFDVLKAYFSVKVSGSLLPDHEFGTALASASVILGHIFPFYMGFKGGKGFACLGGSILAYSLKIALFFLIIELILAFVTNYIVVVPTSASVAFPIVYYMRGGSVAGMLLLFVASAAIFYKHRENFKRIRLGTEAHFSFLWNKDKELDRIKDNLTEDEYEDLQIKRR